MIIERKYVSFYDLCRLDERSKKVFYETIKSSLPEEKALRIINYNLECRNMLYGIDMGACIPRLDLIKEGFQKLDREYPFDNGFTFEDVNDIEMIHKSEKEIILSFNHKCSDGKFIVAVRKVKA